MTVVKLKRASVRIGSSGARTKGVAASDDGALDALILASRAVVAVAARSLPPWADVSLVQFRALVLLQRHGSLKPGRLAELLRA
jgi:hypothetical protein